MVGLAPATGYRTALRGGSAPAARSRANLSADVFICGIGTPGGAGHVDGWPIPGTRSLTLPAAAEGAAPTLEICAGSAASVQAEYDAETGAAMYLWGRAVRSADGGSASAPSSVLRWAAQVAQSADPAPLREMLGNFVLLIDDRRARRITIISDVLAIRPWFVGVHGGRLIGGSNVLALCEAGLSSGTVNYDAVSCWLKYNQTIGSATVSADYHALPPGAVCTFDPAGKLLRETVYGTFECGDEVLPPDDVVDRLHEIVSRSFEALVSGLPAIHLPLSGGFDSRYLMALASRHARPMVYAATLETRDYETALARQVAAALQQPLEVVRSRRRILDLFDDPMVFNPAGFPTGRNLTSALARRRPGMVLVSGFIGDGVMRGSMTSAGAAHYGKDRQNLPPAELARLLDQRYAMHAHRLPLLDPALLGRIHDRARGAIDALVAGGLRAGKPLLYADLHARHRLYFANIFLQHLDIAEAVTPYCTWALINCRTCLANACYTAENYPRLFRRHFPQLAEIPHSSAMKSARARSRRRREITPSRHFRRWGAALAARLLLPGQLAAVQKRRVLPLLRDAAVGHCRYEQEITFFYKLLLFERRIREAKLNFEWDGV